MTERQEIIKGLEKVLDAFNHMEHELYADYVFDALAMLKKQDAKIVIVQDDGCPCYPTCGNELYAFPHYQKYCDECGQKVKWE